MAFWAPLAGLKGTIYLSVLGFPNPGQSFGRGEGGPEATEVKIGCRQSGAQNLKQNHQESYWYLEFGRLRDASDLAARGRVALGFAKFAIFFCQVHFFQFSKSAAVAGIWSPPGRSFCAPNFGRCPLDFENRKFFKKVAKKQNFKICSGSWHLVASRPVILSWAAGR